MEPFRRRLFLILCILELLLGANEARYIQTDIITWLRELRRHRSVHGRAELERCSALALDLAQQSRQPGQVLQYEIGERSIGPANVVAAPRSAFKQCGLHAEITCRNDVVIE